MDIILILFTIRWYLSLFHWILVLFTCSYLDRLRNKALPRSQLNAPIRSLKFLNCLSPNAYQLRRNLSNLSLENVLRRPRLIRTQKQPYFLRLINHLQKPRKSHLETFKLIFWHFLPQQTRNRLVSLHCHRSNILNHLLDLFLPSHDFNQPERSLRVLEIFHF